MSIVGGLISPANLDVNAGSGLLLSASGEFTHQARPSAQAGWSQADLGNMSRRYISGLDFDDFGHVAGYRFAQLNFTGSGSVSVDQDGTNEVIISSSAYTSGSSPSFADIIASGNIRTKNVNDDSEVNLVSSGGTPYINIQRGDSALSDWKLTARGNGSQQVLATSVGTSTLMTVQADGNVGIGTDSPAYILEVAGDDGGSFSASSNSTQGQLSIVGKNSNGSVSAISRLSLIHI